MLSKIPARLVKVATFIAALSVTSIALAEGQASRKQDAVPVEEYSVSQDQVQPVSYADYHQHPGMIVKGPSAERTFIPGPHAAQHRRFPNALPVTVIDRRGLTAIQYKRRQFDNY